MTEEELRDAWAKESTGLPTAFTVAELQQRGVERGGVAGETRPHLERLLVQRRYGELFRFVGFVLLIVVAFVVASSMEATIWSFWLSLVLIAALLALAGRQLLALGATTTALRETHVPGLAPSLGQTAFAPAVVLLLVTASLSSGLYWVAAQRGSNVMRQQRALQPTVSLKPAPLPAAPSKATLSCQERRAALNEQGAPQELLSGLVSLGDECPSELVLPRRALTKTFIHEAVGATRSACVASVNNQCREYARYACQGKPREWLEKDDVLAAVFRADPNWTCVASPTVQILEALSEAMPEKVWLTSFQMRDGTARVTGRSAGPDNVSEFMRGLNNVVWTPKGPGHVVERQRNGNLRVELVSTDEVIEFTSDVVRFSFASLELRSSGTGPHGDWTFTLQTSRAAREDQLESSCQEMIELMEFTTGESRKNVEAQLLEACPDAMLEHYRANGRNNAGKADVDQFLLPEAPTRQTEDGL